MRGNVAIYTCATMCYTGRGVGGAALLANSWEEAEAYHCVDHLVKACSLRCMLKLNNLGRRAGGSCPVRWWLGTALPWRGVGRNLPGRLAMPTQ